MPIPELAANKFMITDDAQLAQAIEQIERMGRALAVLHTDIFPQNKQQFALMAEGPLEELRRLERQVSEYVVPTDDAFELAPQAVAGTTR